MTAASASGAADFFRSITGNWIGTCDQSTDGQQADKKFFSASIREISPTSFQSSFEYYRLDRETGKPARAGDATVVTTIGADGKASSRIVGKGTILVDHKPKPQQHDFVESLVCQGSNTLEGTSSGTIKVSNLPLGLGKNGKVRSGKSSWHVSNDLLSIDQKIKVGFGVLCFTKTFDIVAHYTARRGTDIAGLMRSQISMRTGG
jgi:hypothetical protein